EPFTVIGLFKRSEEFQPVINSLQDYYTYNQTESGTVLLPDAIWPVVYNYDEPKMCVARAARVEDMSNVGKEVADVMAKCVTGNNEELSYKAEDLLEKARNQQELSASTNNLLIWIASIALLVGGIGVMNIMLVSVTERTSEIGLKKALGARKSRILGQFLTESVMLTSLGGILGVAAGIVLAYVISRMSGTPVAISVPAIFLGVGFSMLIGIVFGILPSIKAANLNPIEALRHE
ncbi:MAG: FtsX-like permease family protein, partial [Lachnospiraceae bacterium]|nr:FtsX-like permease family protein [Lachnospiraceae bacterium]